MTMLHDRRRSLDMPHLGKEMYALIEEAYPLCRSITGMGARRTLDLIRRQIALEMHEVPSGTEVFDWVIPKEWNIIDAYVRNAKGEKVIDFQKTNLHVVNYSTPVARTVTLRELRDHLFSIPEHPDWVPYRTSYYKETWGFCLAHRELLTLEDGNYDVHIESSLEHGSLTYGEYCVPGRTTDEVLISCHICHPSLCNDNLSGIALATVLARLLTGLDLRYTYRFLFVPGTIGSIAWLARNRHAAARIRHGLVVACVGDGGPFTYKRTRRGNSELDRTVEHVLRHCGRPYEIRDFVPYGYDERQYCSPGFNLAVGSLTRTPHGEFPEYHTSADDLDFVKPGHLADSLDQYLTVLLVLENNRRFVSQNPFCEPQLGKRGLYRLAGGRVEQSRLELALLWVLNLSDGSHSLLEIAERARLPFELVLEVTRLAEERGLLTVSKEDDRRDGLLRPERSATQIEPAKGASY